MSNKTVIEECVEKSKRLDFMHWFYEHKDRLLKDEKDQIIEAYNAGTSIFSNDSHILNPKSAEDYYAQTYGK